MVHDPQIRGVLHTAVTAAQAVDNGRYITAYVLDQESSFVFVKRYVCI